MINTLKASAILVDIILGSYDCILQHQVTKVLLQGQYEIVCNNLWFCSYVDKWLSMEVYCVDISQISKAHKVPLHFLSTVHFQAGYVSINKSVDRIVLVALLESGVVFKLVYGARVSAVIIDIVVNIPASVLVECGEE